MNAPPAAGSFGAAGSLDTGGASCRIYRLDAVGGSARLPFSLKVLLENLLRNEDGRWSPPPRSRPWRAGIRRRSRRRRSSSPRPG